MKTTVKWLSILLSVLLLAGCAAPAEDPTAVSWDAPEISGASAGSEPAAAAPRTEQALEEIALLSQSTDDAYRTWYEIFVYSFCDSDGDGIGDLKGVISRLDYLQTLGINGIWLMPVHPSTTCHKYNVSDYLSIDPSYGTMEDFQELMGECHKRGIRVILDLVLNHTGSDHVWFRTAVNYLKTLPVGEKPDAEVCKYVDYYNFLQAESGPSGYTPVEGTGNWFYESRFSPDMPDLNLDNENLRQEIVQIMQFWLDKGADGFRLDAVKEFYSGQTEKNIAFLSWLSGTATSIKPDCYLVAEVWDSFSTIKEYYKSGITSIFDYAFGDNNGKITKVLQGAGNPSVVSTYAAALQKADAAYRAANPEYIDAPFLSNHDVGRIAGFAGRDPAKTKLGGAMNLFMSGSAFVYYGEELGMVCGGNDDPSFRAPMLWNDARDRGTTQPLPGCILPESYPMGSLESQMGDDASVWNYYRQAIAIRNALPVISHGIPSVETNLNKGCVSAVRKTWGEKSCIILMNIAKEPAQVDLSGYDGWYLAAKLSADGNPVLQNGQTLQLPACAVAVLLPQVSQS